MVSHKLERNSGTLVSHWQRICSKRSHFSSRKHSNGNHIQQLPLAAMEASPRGPPGIPIPNPHKPDPEIIKRKLIQKGVVPTPKIIHTLQKKQLQKSLRKQSKSLSIQLQLTDSQKESMDQEFHFQTICKEYKKFNKELNDKKRNSEFMVGKPWERDDGMREIAERSKGIVGKGLKKETLEELKEILEERMLVLNDDDVEVEDRWLEDWRSAKWEPDKRRGTEGEAIKFLVDRLSGVSISAKDWKFGRMMRQSKLHFTEGQLMTIIEGLGDKGKWRHALSVVEWIYNDKEHRKYKSRFVYTKLLAVLGKARRPDEALQIFNQMSADRHLYPDMAAYHSIAVTLGQAGHLKKLLNIMERMRQKPQIVQNMRYKNWNPMLEPDVVIYNAVLNACVHSRQWKGVSWVFEQMRKGSLKPNGASYGLSMEVMLQSGKFDLVHEHFRKMQKAGEAPKALNYKVLVRAFWEEGKVDEAIQAIRDMEKRGVVGTAAVYYELICCLSNNGRWQEAMSEVEKLKKLPRNRPLEITFTGMITSSMNGGYVNNCISIFQRMQDHCFPNIGTINAMLKVYGKSDMFSEAKELFEEIKQIGSSSTSWLKVGDSTLNPDAYTYSSMLEASARALQWEYFEYVYKEMALSGFQLDQGKHATLLVEASRAGKGHLLEHAFETTLEAGEIPHPSFFTEMICQAASEQNYARAITLVNTLAYVPFQVSEKQWTDLFVKNGDRVDRGCLQKLLDALCSCQVAQEVTVSNLVRSLRFLGAGLDTSNSMLESKNEELGGIVRTKMPEIYPNTIDGINKYGLDSRVDTASAGNICCNKENDVDIKYIDRRDGEVNTLTGIYYSSGDSAFADNRFLLNDNLKDEFDDLDLELGTSDVYNSHRADMPSADEILESWKESRKGDGIFFPCRLGRRRP